MRYLLLFGMFSVISFSEMTASPKPTAAAPSKEPVFLFCFDCDNELTSFGNGCKVGLGGCVPNPCPGCDE